MHQQSQNMGKLLIIAGVILVIIGVFLNYYHKIPLLGKLPGDILIKKENFTFYFPLASGIIISIILSLVLYLVRKF